MSIVPYSNDTFSYSLSTVQTEAMRISRVKRILEGHKEKKRENSSRAEEAEELYGNADLGDPEK